MMMNLQDKAKMLQHVVLDLRGSMIQIIVCSLYFSQKHVLLPVFKSIELLFYFVLSVGSFVLALIAMSW